MHHAEIAGVEPAARESVSRRRRVLEIALHGDVAAEHDLAHRGAVARHLLHGRGVHHRDAILGRVTHALAGLQPRAIVGGQRIPFLVPRADRGRAVDLGETIDVGDAEVLLLQRLEHGGGGRRGRGHELDLAAERPAFGLGRADDELHDDRRTAHVAHIVVGQRVEDRLGRGAAQAHRGAGHQRQRPREAPAVAVEHRQGPEIDRVQADRPLRGVAVGRERRAAMAVDDALGIAGRARRVVERDRVPLVRRIGPGEIGIAVGDEFLPGRVADLRTVLAFGIVDVDDQRLGFGDRQRLGDDAMILAVDQQHLGLAMVDDEGDHRRVEAGVERIEHAAGHRHAEMRLVHLGNVGRHDRHRVADSDADLDQRRGETPAACIGLGPGLAALAVDQRDMIGIDAGGALDELQRGQCRIVRGRPVEVALVDVLRGKGGLVRHRTRCGQAGHGGAALDRATQAGTPERLGSGDLPGCRGLLRGDGLL